MLKYQQNIKEKFEIKKTNDYLVFAILFSNFLFYYYIFKYFLQEYFLQEYSFPWS